MDKVEKRMPIMCGASPAARERMRAADEEAIWRGQCRHCRATLKGTLARLREHVCENG